MTKEKDNKIVYIQGVITQSDLDRLKEKTGEQCTKDAVRVAIEAYLNKGE